MKNEMFRGKEIECQNGKLFSQTFSCHGFQKWRLILSQKLQGMVTFCIISWLTRYRNIFT